VTVLGAAAPAQAGPVGLLVIVLLGVATLLLIRSMGKHLRKVPESFDPPADDPPDDAPGRVE
jgi:L-asparagine transporter-like permease